MIKRINILIIGVILLVATSCEQETDCSVCDNPTSAFKCQEYSQCALAFPSTPGGTLKCICNEDAGPVNDCNDGILNYDEEEIDCGGQTCGTCDCTILEKKCSYCTDGISSPYESAVDCGINCPKCFETFSFTFNNTEIIVDVPSNVFSIPPGITIRGKVYFGLPDNIGFTFKEEALGVHNITTGWVDDFLYKNGGTVTVTEIDKANRRISGTFSFIVSKEWPPDYPVTGVFKNYKY